MAAMAFEDEDAASRRGRERLLGSSVVMESMWRDLPSDILGRVVTFLPIASLLRFKTVSKKWNKLISHPDFASRHASPEDYVLVTLRFDAYENNPIRGWEVLDVANKRFFTLSNDFLTEYAKREGLVPASLPDNSFNERAVLAADGGLLCVSYSFNEQSTVLLVCNPVLQSVKQLPPLTGWVAGTHRVVMKVDRASMEYEVFVVNDAQHQYKPKTILIYKSKTATWGTVSNISPSSNSWDYVGKPWCSVSKFVKNEFYEPFSRTHHAGIVSYDKVTGVLSDLGVDLPFGDAINLQLVVSNDRLFSVTRSESEFSDISIEICEIILAKRDYVWLTEMPSELVSVVLGDELLHDPFVAVGCANSILVFSVTGQSVAYSLSDKVWLQYPDNNLQGALHKFGEAHQEVYGSKLSNYRLSLYAP